jgi:hypothetical protein
MSLRESLELLIKTSGTRQAAQGFKDVADSADKNLGSAEKTAKGFTSRIGGALQGFAQKIPGLNKLIGPDVVSATSLGTGAIAGFATGAGVAIAKFATDSVTHFKNLGLEIGKFRDSTGVTADQASRFVEMAKDLGIGSDTIQGAIGKMNKAIGNTPQLFANAGIEIARTKDGAVDVNGTFLNVIDTLHAIKDPTEQAALAAKIFGKGYQSLSEIIQGGSSKIRESFASISKEKLFDDKEIEKARRLRDALDKFHDSVEDIQLAVGEELAPALAEAATSFAKLIEAAKPLLGVLDPIVKGIGGAADVFSGFTSGVEGVIKHLGPIKTGLDVVGEGAKAFGRSLVDPFGAANDLGHKVASLWDHSDERKEKAEQEAQANQAAGDRLTAMAEAYGQAADAAAELEVADAAATAQAMADADKAAADQAQRMADTNNAAAAAILGRIDAQRAATDATYAGEKAQRDFNEANDAANKVFGDSKATLEQWADATEHGREAAGQLADSAVNIATQQAKARGAVLSAKDAVDIQNKSLLASAATAKGPLKAAIGEYIGRLNDIPPEKVAEIKALLDKGDIAGAERVINQTSRTRTAAINADAHTSQAERDLNYVARTRVARIEAAVARGGSQNSDQFTQHAAGGTVHSPFQLVGEHGPELAALPNGTKVTPAGQTAGILARGGTTNVQIIMPAGANPKDVAAAIRRTQKRNGT